MRLLLFEDNPFLRDSLTILLENTPDIRLVGAYSTPLGWEKLVFEAKPDVILMDIEMPGLSGIDATRAIHRTYPQLSILMLTVFSDDQKIFEALCAGAVGYILKNTSSARLIDALYDAQAGGSPMSPAVARRVVHLFQQIAARQLPHSNAPSLTNREAETLRYLVDGLSYKLIADRMGISFETVRSHIKHIYEKLHVVTKAEAVVKAVREGLV